ncbi:hypothetical protein F5879DRAFT_638988 [Lentinula edodes]|nr:hypothetical protein F5879DRAFT_638988 [Lentinula edodes]
MQCGFLTEYSIAYRSRKKGKRLKFWRVIKGGITCYVSAIHDIEVIQLTNLAAGTVIIYDHLLTLNDEFEHIWQNSWSMGKALFIINRYYSLIATVVSKKTSDESLFNDDFRINNYALFGTLNEAVFDISTGREGVVSLPA